MLNKPITFTLVGAVVRWLLKLFFSKAPKSAGTMCQEFRLHVVCAIQFYTIGTKCDKDVIIVHSTDGLVLYICVYSTTCRRARWFGSVIVGHSCCIFLLSSNVSQIIQHSKNIIFFLECCLSTSILIFLKTLVQTVCLIL